MTQFLFLGVGLLLTTLAVAGSEDAYDKTTDGKKIVWMDRGKVSVKAKLKDPESAQFRGLYFHRGKDGIPMTCGEVNSKNGFGGYVGFQRFLSAGTVELTMLQHEAPDFSAAWNRACR